MYTTIKKTVVKNEDDELVMAIMPNPTVWLDLDYPVLNYHFPVTQDGDKFKVMEMKSENGIKYYFEGIERKVEAPVRGTIVVDWTFISFERP